MTMPYWTEDPRVDAAAHRLRIDRVETASAVAGRDLWTGSCSCQTMTSTPPWDEYAVHDAHELHMQLVQVAAHQADIAATRTGGEQ
ncbi:hypothetical protein [Nocardia testacea]|uniref:hypothetical protein n=1 Tax=Nocardia testacea TaxID=248551 RepID=UPI0033CD372A